MTDNQSNSGNSGGNGGGMGMAFILGAVVVVLAIVAWFVFGRGVAPETKDVNVDISLPEVSAPAVPGTGN